MAKASKDTFWNRERLKRNLTLEDIAKKLRVPRGSVGNWFCGASVPNDQKIQELCTIFDINYDTGYNAFYHAKRSWDSEGSNHAYYKNFWSDIRLKSGFTFEEIAEMLDKHPGQVSNWFTGRYVPKKDNIKAICKLFDVEEDKGTAEFIAAHQAYIESSVKSPHAVEVEPTEVKEVPTDEGWDFWPNLLKQYKFSFHDIALFLSVSDAKVASYFSGEQKPNFNQIRMLCRLFGGVDMTEGSNKFELLHNHYLNASNEEAAPVVHTVPTDYDTVLRSIYGIVDWDVYNEVYNILTTGKGSKDILRAIYDSNVSFATFKLVADKLSSL